MVGTRIFTRIQTSVRDTRRGLKIQFQYVV